LFLFIFESIGTSELILIGIIALVFLGPRRLPEMARKLGKIMADLRNTTNEFKETWEREVNFEEEAKALRIDEDDMPQPRTAAPEMLGAAAIAAPAVKEVDAARFDEVVPPAPNGTGPEGPTEPEPADNSLSEKKNWL
jgi:sec-independent protein translocase protein TatB